LKKQQCPGQQTKSIQIAEVILHWSQYELTENNSTTFACHGYDLLGAQPLAFSNFRRKTFDSISGENQVLLGKANI